MGESIVYSEVKELQAALDLLLSDRKNIKVLEAGCGADSYLRLGEEPYLVGIDVSPEQLTKNKSLNEKILGDIQTYNFPSSAFDAIVCWNVLEHLYAPETALKNFVQALKENGIIIIAIPNLFSVKGLLTKFTPHWFHILVYQHIYGEKSAGKPGFEPFPTFLKFSIAPVSIKQFALKNSLSVEYFAYYEFFWQKTLREKYKMVGVVWKLLKGITKLLTFGHIDLEYTDYIIVMKKQKTSVV